MSKLFVHHVTTYHYAKPVTFGVHRLMFRPRDSHDMRLLGTQLIIGPAPAEVRWLHDVFGNSITVVQFSRSAAELRLESRIYVNHYGVTPIEFPIEDYARTYPFAYSADDVQDLGRTRDRHYPDPEHKVDEWAKAFVVRVAGAAPQTQDLLVAMTTAIKRDFRYLVREAVGTQPPTETLALKTGTCRDFALLMMEAARSLGFAARFVSGYLYDPAVDSPDTGPATVGGGASHAWVQIYLPGAGWVEFDPTNGIIGGRNLIRVAVTRDPSQAVPLAGEWRGRKEDFLKMEVSVLVTSEPLDDIDRAMME
ncbi:MAG: transglutaminase family protein [Azospirillaceae bacterium]|nr:transglutaminase family protein [Azospirillaceae bacterium]